MKKYLKALLGGISLTMFCSTGCISAIIYPDLHFEWFNLGTNDIWVIAAKGLPTEASPGLLPPVKSETQLTTKESIFNQTVRAGDVITITWKDNGPRGFPGGLPPPGKTLPGTTHEAKFNRADLGVPKKLRTGKIRFTYLGNSQWRIRFFAGPNTGYGASE